MSQELELYLFEIDQEQFHNEIVYYMYWPKEWRSFIESIKNGQFKYPLKSTSLGEKLRGIFPEIISIHSSQDVISGNKPWIVAKHPIDIKHLRLISLRWFAHQLKGTINELDENIQNGELKWNDGTVKELAQKMDKYQWLPSLYTHQFCQTKHHLIVDGQIDHWLTFHPVVFNDENECMSELLKDKDRHDYFSYVLRFKLITRGIENKPLLSVRAGIRRFFQKPVLKGKPLFQSWKRSASVLVSVQHPFLNVGNPIHSFAQLKVKSTRDQGEFSKWAKEHDNLFADVLLGETFQSDDLFTDPLSYMKGKGDVTAFIVYNDNVFKNNYAPNVLKGVGLPEKNALMNIVKRFFTMLQPLKRLPEVPKPKPGLPNKRLPLIAPREINHVILEVWGSEELFEKVKTVLLTKKIDDQTIAISEFSGNRFILNTVENEVILEVRRLDPSRFTCELEFEKYKEKASFRRIKEIEKELDPAEELEVPVIALIEIDEEWKQGTDPKQAVRIGFRSTGRITQFIYPLNNEEDANDNRVLNSIIDLLADTGFLRYNWLKFKPMGVILSLSLLKIDNNKFIPVLSKIENQLLTFKPFGNDKWYSQHEALLSINRAIPIKSNDESKGALKRFLVNEIMDTLKTTDQDVYLLLNASLRNKWMVQMKNGNLHKETILSFDERLENEKRLKVIRINTTSDVPQYRIIKNGNEEDVNKNQGLFRDALGIYYSVGERPDTFPRVANAATKFKLPRKQLLQQQAVEIIPLGVADENERDLMAYMVHSLRKMNITYKQHVQQPFPIHRTKSLLKYHNEINENMYYEDEFEESIIVVAENDQLEFVVEKL